jgi:hypothetical protein
MIEEQHGLAGRSVAHLDTIGIARRAVDHIALDAMLGEFRIAQAIETAERLGRKTGNAEHHGCLQIADGAN